MDLNVVDFAKDRTIYNITGSSKEELENKLNLFFSKEGYKLMQARGENRVYEKGNRAAHILLGAFAKYHKVFLAVKQEQDLYSLRVQRDYTGMSGGMISMNQVRKEFERLTEALGQYFRN